MVSAARWTDPVPGAPAAILIAVGLVEIRAVGDFRAAAVVIPAAADYAALQQCKDQNSEDTCE
jgi:hypothetical protein